MKKRIKTTLRSNIFCDVCSNVFIPVSVTLSEFIPVGFKIVGFEIIGSSERFEIREIKKANSARSMDAITTVKTSVVPVQAGGMNYLSMGKICALNCSRSREAECWLISNIGPTKIEPDEPIAVVELELQLED